VRWNVMVKERLLSVRPKCQLCPIQGSEGGPLGAYALL
jgi:hypothetical protein